MPYIKPDERVELDPTAVFGLLDPETPGQLNYMISRLLSHYFVRHPNYQGVNDCLGALEGAKMEFYRRVAAPYEDAKLAVNGDVY